MKKKIFVSSIVAMFTFGAFGSETCYQLSIDGQRWSRTPEYLCTVDMPHASSTTLVLKTSKYNQERIFATLNLNLLSRSRCMDCNGDVYGMVDSSGSIFNRFAVKFNGKKLFDGSESGVVEIGDQVFYYSKR